MVAAESVVTEFASAKVNLYLHVTGKREDGYHLLDSLVAFASIGDELEMESDDQFSLEIKGPFADQLEIENNLVLKAAHAYADHVRLNNRGAKIVLTKNLPLASGIGGGSADAAAVLRGLGRLWPDTKPSSAAIEALALSLGADLPICLASRTAYFGGIGECLSPTPLLPKAGLVLVNPLVQVSTVEIFKRRAQHPFTPEMRLARWPETVSELAEMLSERCNDLQPSAITFAPVIGDVLSALKATKGCRFSRMSGSGATCFALFDGPNDASEATKTLRRQAPDWWISEGELSG